MDCIICFVGISPFNVSRRIQRRGDKDDNAETGDTLATGLLLAGPALSCQISKENRLFNLFVDHFLSRRFISHIKFLINSNWLLTIMNLLMQEQEPDAKRALTFIEKEIFQIWGRVEDHAGQLWKYSSL